MSIEAMKQARDFISRLKFADAEPEPEIVMTVLDQAIAEAEKQEPVAVVCGYYGGQCVILPLDPARIFNSNTPLYTSPQPAQQERTMPITDDHGKAIQYQYRVIEQRGNWFLLYDQNQLGNTVVHEFRIQKLKHDIVLFPGITLAEAQKRFAEKVEADNE